MAKPRISKKAQKTEVDKPSHHLSISRPQRWINELQEHRVIAIIVILAFILIGIGKTTDAIQSIVKFSEVYIRSVPKNVAAHKNSEDKVLIEHADVALFRKTLEQHITLSDNEEISEELRSELSLNEYSVQVGNFFVMATNNQYKRHGLISFFYAPSRKITFVDTDFPMGITGIKATSIKEGPIQFILQVKYITMTGTGTYSESVRFYSIGTNDVWTSLDKPYREVNSGWGAFTSHTVTFETKNSLVFDKKSLQIFTNGVVILHEEGETQAVQYRDLPQEIYVWNNITKQFDQIKGRATKNTHMLTELYSDIATPKGNWFKKPKELKDGEVSQAFFSEKW